MREAGGGGMMREAGGGGWMRRWGSEDEVDDGEERYCAAGPLVWLIILYGYSWELAVVGKVWYFPVSITVEFAKGVVYVVLCEPWRWSGMVI